MRHQKRVLKVFTICLDGILFWNSSGCFGKDFIFQSLLRKPSCISFLMRACAEPGQKATQCYLGYGKPQSLSETSVPQQNSHSIFEMGQLFIV